MRRQLPWPLPERIYFALAIAMVAAFAITLIFWTLDARTLDGGVSIWAKPLKFELALALHAGTLGLVVSRLSQTSRTDLAMQLLACAFLAACIVEMGYIIAQAAQGEHSHFNDSSAFHRVMFSAMAFCAVIITGAAGAIALSVWRDLDFGAAAPLKVGIVLGLLGGALLTLVTAFAIGGRGSPYVGGAPALDARMMFTGWSQTAGDLRVAHFLATHMIQVVPIAAVLAMRASLGRSVMPVVSVFAALWACWVLLEFRVALAGGAPVFLALLH